MTTPVGAVAKDADSTAKSAPKGGSSIFSKKYGPLPGWAWTGLVALGALGFVVWRSHGKKAATPTTAAATVSQFGQSTTGYGASIATLQGEVQQLQGALSHTGSTTATTTVKPTTGTKTTATTAPSTVGPQVVVPKVVGLRVTPAIAKITAAGFTYKLSSERNPISEYEVNSQTPGAGSKAAKGSRVDLGIVKL